MARRRCVRFLVTHKLIEHAASKPNKILIEACAKALNLKLPVSKEGQYKAIIKHVALLAKPEKASSDNFYESSEWQKVRYKALLKHNGSCQCCGASPSKGKPLHVDHIKPRSTHSELELVVDNLQVLCKDCNFGKGAWDETDWRR